MQQQRLSYSLTRLMLEGGVMGRPCEFVCLRPAFLTFCHRLAPRFMRRPPWLCADSRLLR